LTHQEPPSAEPPLFQPDAALALRLASYSLLAGAALAQAGPALAEPDRVSGTPADLPYTFPAPPGGDQVTGVTNQFDLDVNGDGSTDVTFYTFYANVFEPVVASSWTTIQVWLELNNADGGNVTKAFMHKDWAKNWITSRACNGAYIGSAGVNGPGISRSGQLLENKSYIAFYRKTRVGCATCTNQNYHTYIYDAGQWPDHPGDGAIPLLLVTTTPDEPSVAVVQHGWIAVTLPGRTTELTVDSVTLGPAEPFNAPPVTVEGIGSCPATDVADADLAATPRRGRTLALPLPDGSVPMTLGLLATGATGNQLWRAAQHRIAGLPPPS
jgi:hypothetical protein